MMLIDKKTARELENTLSRYGLWMRQLRRYAMRRYGLLLREDAYPGCVMQKDLMLLYKKELQRTVRTAADWCWIVDAVSRMIRDTEDEQDAERLAGLMRLYYGLNLSPELQEKWNAKPSAERRHLVMKTLNMEQTTFYQVRAQLLAALYMAAVQRRLFRPYPEDVMGNERGSAVS